MAENWYIILELEFDPNPVHDQATIDARIDEKAKFWSSKFNDFNKGAEYRKYHQMIPDIRKAMSNPDERKQLIKEACDITYGPIDKLIKMIGRKGEITSDELQNIATRQKANVDVVKNRALAIGIKIGEAKAANFQAIYDKCYKSKPQNAATFDGMASLLKSFGVDNLYDFLGTGTHKKSPCDTLRQMAKDKKKNEFYKNDSISGSGSKLCAQCELVFKDESSKTVYDNYLEYTYGKAILDEIKGIAEISGELSEEQGKAFIEQLTEIFKDEKPAIEVLVAFCKIEKIQYNPSGIKEPCKRIIVCRNCGRINDVTDGKRTACEKCSEELYIKCPKCGTINEATIEIKVCKCGFKLENIDKAVALCYLAETEINRMDFTVAEARLTDAERYWPGSDKVNTLRKKLAESKQRIGTAAESMRVAASEKRYCEAKKQYANIQKLFPEFKETDLENEIQAALDSAGSALKQAQAAKAEKDILDFCVKAYEFCKDYPGVQDLIPPPLPPANLKISADGNTRTNILNWDKSASEGMIYYTVTRKKDTVPINMNDGDALGRVSVCNFSDNKVEPTAAYFYAVFAERAGVQSKPLFNTVPVTNLFEISNLSITAGDSLLQLEWDALPSGATAEVYRQSGTGKEEKINSTTSTSYLDSGLKNDTLYSYIVKLVYILGGKHQSTHGISISGSPTKPPNPIETLRIKPDNGDMFTAEWSNPDNLNVELYCSTEKPPYKYGEVVSQQAIEKKMRRMAVNRTSGTTATFQHKGNETLYISATVIKSGSVIFGAVARASRGETVNIKNIVPINNKIHILIDVPQGATGFIVLYRFDKFPDDISDTKTVRRYMPLKQYLHNNALVIDTLERENYYFSVFAEFTKDGEKDYSVGADYLFQNASKEVITYSISKNLFGERAVILKFEAEKKTFRLPDIEVRSGIGTAPMNPATAKLFHTIPAQSVEGSVQIKIPIENGLPRDTYIKPFLKDEALASNYQLKLKLKSNHKIS